MPKKATKKAAPITEDGEPMNFIDRMYRHVMANNDTWVPATVEGEVLVNERSYFIRGGERLWLEHGSETTFYVTLEDQNVQLRFEKIGRGVLVDKRLLGGSGMVKAQPRRPVTHSS